MQAWPAAEVGSALARGWWVINKLQGVHVTLSAFRANRPTGTHTQAVVKAVRQRVNVQNKNAGGCTAWQTRTLNQPHLAIKTLLGGIKSHKAGIISNYFWPLGTVHKPPAQPWPVLWVRPAEAAAGPSDLLPSSPTLVLLSSRQITSSLRTFLSLGSDAADTRLVASPGEAGQEVRMRMEEVLRTAASKSAAWFVHLKTFAVVPTSHRWCIRAAAVPTPPAAAAPAVAFSAAPPAGRLWSRPPTDAPSVTSCEVRQTGWVVRRHHPATCSFIPPPRTPLLLQMYYDGQIKR